MTGKDIHSARAKIGKMWGLKRPLYLTELGELLRLTGRDPGATVRLWENDRNPVSGPAATAVEAMLSGFKPAHWESVVRKPRPE